MKAITGNARIKIILAILSIVLAVLQYRFWCGDDGLLKAFSLKHMLSEAQAKNTDIAVLNADLISEIAALKRGGAAIENRARGDLGMVKKGEIFYQVVK